MIIPINLATERHSSSRTTFPPQLAQFGSDEIVLIELQGTLEVDGDRAGQMVGKLVVDTATKKPTLLIGHHLLEGKLVNLPKPLAVLHRTCSTTEGSEDEDASMADDSETHPKRTQSAWDIVAVVKRKMVFSKRPMPMVGRILTPAETSKPEITDK